MTPLQLSETALAEPLRMLFPDIGRKLTTQDIGKRIIRVFPSPHKNDYDWSNCYWQGHQAFLVEASTKNVLEKIAEDGSLVISNSFYNWKNRWDPKWNDSCWTTVDELSQYLGQNPKPKYLALDK